MRRNDIMALKLSYVIDSEGRKYWLIPAEHYDGIDHLPSQVDGPVAHPTSSESIGSQLRRIRIDKGLKLRAVARALKMSPATLCNVEKGRTIPEEVTVSRVMNYLKKY